KLIATHENSHDEAIWCIDWALSESGKNRIVTGSLDDTIKIWNWNPRRPEQLELEWTFEGHYLGVVALKFDHTGNTLASVALDSTIILWDLSVGEQFRSIDPGPVNAWGIDFSPDSKYVATSAQSFKILLYSTDTGEKLPQEYDTAACPFVQCLALSKDGKWLAGGGTNGIILLFDVEEKKLVSSFGGHAMIVRSLAFSNDSNYLVSVSDDSYVKVYDLREKKDTETDRRFNTINFSGHCSWVLNATFAPDNNHFATGSADKTVKIWNVESPECIHTFTNHKDQVWGVKYSPCGNFLASVSEDKSICIYQVVDDVKLGNGLDNLDSGANIEIIDGDHLSDAENVQSPEIDQLPEILLSPEHRKATDEELALPGSNEDSPVDGSPDVALSPGRVEEVDQRGADEDPQSPEASSSPGNLLVLPDEAPASVESPDYASSPDSSEARLALENEGGNEAEMRTPE
ncbi:WD repeat-containing protein 61, partial [Tyrophagus putrescentiae]